MPLFLILAFPLAEIATFIIIGQAIGVIATLLLIAASSALGWVLLRDAGALTMANLRRRPADAAQIMADGGARAAAGVLLLIPGFLTDLIALALLIAPIRIRAVAAFRPESRSARHTVIETDFRRLDG